MSRIRKSSYTSHEHFNGEHRFEHWYRDNMVYFITAKVRDGFHAFKSESAKAIFWDRFNFYTGEFGFTPFLTTLMDNHYHTEGYLKVGQNLGQMMRKIHGSVAWMVNKDNGIKHVPFWRGESNRDYFDGCIRDVLQAERAYRYTLMQAVRAGIVRDYRDYPHTIVNVEMSRAISRALELKAFLEEVPYARYENRASRRGHRR